MSGCVDSLYIHGGSVWGGDVCRDSLLHQHIEIFIRTRQQGNTKPVRNLETVQSITGFFFSTAIVGTWKQKNNSLLHGIVCGNKTAARFLGSDAITRSTDRESSRGLHQATEYTRDQTQKWRVVGSHGSLLVELNAHCNVNEKLKHIGAYFITTQTLDFQWRFLGKRSNMELEHDKL